MSWNIAKPGDQINGPVAVTGNLNVDSNTLFVDSANNRVGVLTASPTVPLDVVGDAKVSGNLTVDTNTLVVDAANNRLGINEASPQSSLHVALPESERLIVEGYFTPGDSKTGLLFGTSQTDRRAAIDVGIVSGGSGYLTFSTSSAASVSALTERLRIGNDGVCTWSNVGGVAGTAMTLDGTGLGVGVAPAVGYKISTNGNVGLQYGSELRLINTDNSSAYAIKSVGTGGGNKLYFTVPGIGDRMVLDYNGNLGIGTTSTSISGGSRRALTLNSPSGQLSILELAVNGTICGYLYSNGSITTLNSQSTAPLTFETNGAERLRIDSSGNVGLGVTPSAWGAGLKALQVGAVSYGSLFDFGNGVTSLSSNLFFSGSSYGRMSTSSRWSMAYWQDITNGAHSWVTSTAAGTNASTPTMSTLMLLDASGNLLINRASTIGTNSKLNVQLHGTSASTYSAPSNAAISVDAGTSDNCVIALVGGGDQGIYRANSSGAYDVGISLGSNAERRIRFTTAGTDKMVLDASGNLGLGVTPSAWGPANFKAIDINTRGTFAGTSGGAYVVYNAFYNASNQWIYKQSDTAAYYAAELGAHKWFTASSGTAGNQITWTQPMTLDASGNLGIGLVNPSSYGKLAVSVNGSSQSGLTFVDTNTSGRSWLIGPGIGTGLGSDFGFYDNTGTQIASLYTAGASGKWAWYTNGTERLRIKSTGQVNFVGQASDPAGAAAGDVYYNTTTNKLKCYNGTTWNDLF